MKEFLPVLQKSTLFSGIEPEELLGLLACLGARIAELKKNQPVLLEGDPATKLGIVLSGAVQISRDDLHGNRSILGRAEPSEVFAESYAFAGANTLPVNVVAQEDSRLLLIDSCRITQSCSNACGFHQKLIRNLLQIVSEKNLRLHRKLEVTAKRTTREKLLTYLYDQEKRHGSRSFTIPFDRQALADYLEVERSAMSAELSKLRKDGIIEYDRSHFTMLQ